jgi:EPS-associated MarR family transcriptional regulator
MRTDSRFTVTVHAQKTQGRAVACPTMPEETHYKVLKILEQNPQVSQRELANELGVSLGKANYCLKALIEKGLVKANNFKNSANKRAYIYVLTPSGIEAKAKISVRFLQRKLDEYEALRAEIEELQTELGKR